MSKAKINFMIEVHTRTSSNRSGSIETRQTFTAERNVVVDAQSLDITIVSSKTALIG